MRVIDFFCGGGGFSEGFRQAGFKVIQGFDKWNYALNTNSENHRDCITINYDIEELSQLPDNEFHKVVADSEVIVGSPPCVAFSNSVTV